MCHGENLLGMWLLSNNKLTQNCPTTSWFISQMAAIIKRIFYLAYCIRNTPPHLNEMLARKKTESRNEKFNLQINAMFGVYLHCEH